MRPDRDEVNRSIATAIFWVVLVAAIVTVAYWSFS